MKNVLFAALACALVVTAALLAVEGVHSLAAGRKPHVSLSYEALSALDLVGAPKKTKVPEGAYAPYITDADEVSDLIEPLTEAGIAIGNSPYEELRTDNAALNTEADDGCIGPKPNRRKTAFFLRSPIFNPLNPMSVGYDAGKQLDDRLTAFFDRYGTPPVTMSTNAQGERVTLPLVERSRKVLVAGDSVAFGAMINDADTIASQLQARDLQRQYVNLGVSGVAARDIVCRLEAAARRYSGQVDELIYVYCENDFDPKLPYGKPEEMIDWLAQFAAREAIGKVTVVFAPYIYTIAPEVTRFDGYVGGGYPHREREREDLMKAVEAAGFRWVDIGTLARQEQARRNSQFGFFPMFVDQVHLSPEGTALVVDRLTAP
jgi:lysophospholipase L1-like esterase